jgi:hypothetical protein
MRHRHLASSFLFVLAAACGGDSKNPAADAAPDSPEGAPIDAPGADAAPAPAMITITGTAVERTVGGTSPVAGATVAGYRNGNDATAVATATTAANGTFTLTIATGGVALDGYIKATKTGLKDTYLYPPTAIAADIVAPVNMISPGTLNVLTAFASGMQTAGKGLIALVVVSGMTADSTPVTGAMVSSTPAAGPYRYNGGNGLPDPQATMTAADGTAFIFNVPPNVNVVVNATKAGSTFTSHGVRAVPDQFTTTLITP